MKPIFLILACSLSILNTYSQPADNKNNFILTGHVKNFNNRYIYLSYRGFSKDRLWDSAKVMNDIFTFKGTIDDSYTNAFLTTLTTNRLHDLESPEITPRIFLDASAMSASLTLHDFQHAIVSGSHDEDAFVKLERSKASLRQSIGKLNGRYYALEAEFETKRNAGAKPDTLVRIQDDISLVRIATEPFLEKLKNIDIAFIKANPRSYVTAYLLNDYTSTLPVDELNGYYNRMPEAVQQCYYGKEIRTAIAKLMKGSPGSIAADFNATELSGVPISLSSYKGQYVLLDFWASWCTPCRQGNPALKKLYEKYRGRGIEFISIGSATDSRNNWQSAITQDGIGIWKHVLDVYLGNTNKGAIDLSYSIQSLPTQILIDPSGMIIGRYGDGGEGDDKLPLKLKMIFEK